MTQTPQVHVIDDDGAIGACHCGACVVVVVAIVSVAGDLLPSNWPELLVHGRHLHCLARLARFVLLALLGLPAPASPGSSETLCCQATSWKRLSSAPRHFCVTLIRGAAPGTR